MNVPIEQCTSAACYRPAPVRRYTLLALLVALYAWSVPFCYNTVGEPRAAAILRAQRLDDEKWAEQSMQVGLQGLFICPGSHARQCAAAVERYMRY